MMTKQLYAIIYGFFVLTVCASAELEFRAVTSIGGVERFWLADSGTGLGWFHIGSRVSGFSISSYDTEKAILHLRNDSVSLELSLADAIILEASNEVYSEISFSLNENKTDVLCRFKVGQKQIFELPDGRDLTFTLRRDSKGFFLYDTQVGIHEEIDVVTVTNIRSTQIPVLYGKELITYVGDIKLHIMTQDSASSTTQPDYIGSGLTPDELKQRREGRSLLTP